MRNSTTFLSKFYKIVVNAIIAYEKLAVACQYPRISVRGGIEVIWVGVGIGLKPTGKKTNALGSELFVHEWAESSHGKNDV